MSLQTVSQLKDSVAGIISGIDLGNVDNLYGAFERAAKVLVQKAYIPEASGKQNLTLYAGVIDYLCDTRIFGTEILDLRPQGVSRDPSDVVYKRPQEQFDRTKGYLPNGSMVTFEYTDGVPTIRVKTTLTQQQLVLDTMTDTTGWTTGGSLSGLTQDRSFYYQSPASLRYNLAALGASGYIEKTISPVDMTSYQGLGVCFLAVEMPTGSDFTDFGVRIGSSSSNYYQVSNTAGFLGAFTSGEFQLVALDLAQATTVGAPDITKISYIRAFVDYNGTAQTNARFGGLWVALPTPVQLIYQSVAIFKAGSSQASTNITTDADTILLNDSAYNLYEYEAALSVLQQVGGGSADPTIAYLTSILHGAGNEIGLYGHYRGDNPSQELRTCGSWYD